MLETHRWILKAVVLTTLLLPCARAADAGPPLICHPFDAGTAPLLPWGTGPGWNTPHPAYEIQRLVDDTLRLLSPDAPILARMENLRRATIYASRDRRVTADLLSVVLGRALTAAANGSRDPLAWFDAGYLIESYRQASATARWNMLSGAERSAWTLRNVPHGLDGYELVRKALELRASPEMEFAASLMKNGAISAQHRQRAAAGSTPGSLLAKNLAR